MIVPAFIRASIPVRQDAGWAIFICVVVAFLWFFVAWAEQLDRQRRFDRWMKRSHHEDENYRSWRTGYRK